MLNGVFEDLENCWVVEGKKDLGAYYCPCLVLLKDWKKHGMMFHCCVDSGEFGFSGWIASN